MSLTRPTITGFSGLFSDTLGAPDVGAYTQLPLAQNGNRGNIEPKLARKFKGETMREIVAALAATIGAAAGGTATSTYKRRKSQNTPVDVGSFDEGNVTIETQTVINRVTTAADISYLKQIFSGRLTASNITYPAALGGNQDQGPARF